MTLCLSHSRSGSFLWVSPRLRVYPAAPMAERTLITSGEAEWETCAPDIDLGKGKGRL